MEQGQFTFNTGQLIAFGTLLVGLIIAIVAIIRLRWSMRTMQMNHFETFKKDVYRQLNNFKESCAEHKTEVARTLGEFGAKIEGLDSRLERIENKLNSN